MCDQQLYGAVITDFYHAVYATESKKKAKGVSRFERRLNDLGIWHVPAGVAHPRTNGNLERARGELQRKLHLFHDVAGRPGICSSNSPHIEMGPVAWFVRWHNNEWSHMPLDADVGETPEIAFERKTPPPGSDITDE